MAKEKAKTEKGKKGIFGRLLERLDSSLEKKSKESCCCCSGKCSK
jgi:hypothetical protein